MLGTVVEHARSDFSTSLAVRLSEADSKLIVVMFLVVKLLSIFSSLLKCTQDPLHS